MRLLFEIGMEELPARFLKDSLNSLKYNLEEKFKHERIIFDKINTYGTPRRLVIEVINLAEKQEDLNKTNLGPAKSVAFDSNGKISNAGIGFAKSQGLKVEDLEIIKTDKGEYVGVTIHKSGMLTKTLLPDILKNLVLDFTFPKSMRWSDKNLRFARPIQWFLAVCDNEIINFEIENIKSSNKSKGHRFFGHDFEIKNADEYFIKIRENNVIIDLEERKQLVRKKVEEACDKSQEKVLIDENLLNEVANLIEYPYAIVGNFNPNFLEVPQDVLIISMEVHQRYFPILDLNGKLLPKFVVVRNGIKNSDYVRLGNEKVLSARLADARFFYQEDLKHPLIDNVEKLKSVVFQKDLGTIYEKIKRMSEIGKFLIKKLSLEKYETSILKTILLAKADLVSNMIGEKEFTKLQGFMGADYALKNGESKEVSKGIEEHYYPRFQGDKLPSSIEGVITGIADRMDTLVGCFGVGVIPSGSKDPFALRRAALGIVNIILNSKLNISLSELTKTTLNILINSGKLKRKETEIQSEVMSFFKQRILNVFMDSGYEKDIVNSIVAKNYDNIVEIKEKAETLKTFIGNNTFNEFLPTLKRVENISKDYNGNIAIDTSYFEKNIEKELYDFSEKMQTESQNYIQDKKYINFLDGIIKSKGIVDKYFDEVMIMVSNEKIKKNRLAQMKKLTAIYNMMSDLNMLGE